MTATTPTLVVGFDALDFEYLDRFAGSLPNFGQIRKEGVQAPLESTHPPWTGCAWPSMYTGTDPSHHGVYDFFSHDNYPDDATISTRNDVSQPALWNYVTEENGSSIVLNVPVTHPAEEINGALVPGYLSTEDSPGTPNGIREEISEAIDDDYTIYSTAETASNKDEMLNGYLNLIDRRASAAETLLSSRSWDLAFVQVQKTDAVFHNFQQEDAFKEVYKAADTFLGRVRTAVNEPVNIIICSDHGIGHKSGYAIYVNEILREHDLVEGTANGSESKLSSVKTELTGQESQSDSTSLVTRFASTAGAMLAKSGLSPATVYNTAHELRLGPVVDAVVPSTVKNATAQTVDWRASKAYCRSNAELGIRINLSGREPDGVVPRDEYESVRNDIIDILRNVKTPDGEPAFELVARREAVYNGPHTEDACDIIFVPNGMNHTVGTKLYGRQFVPIDLYDHEREGVFIADGPDVDSTASISTASLTDIAPYVMALLDYPVPERMTGQAPSELIDGEVHRADYGSVPFGTTDDERSREDEVTERLEDLGYI